MIKINESWYGGWILVQLLHNQPNKLRLSAHGYLVCLWVDQKADAPPGVVGVMEGMRKRFLAEEKIPGFDGFGRESTSPAGLGRSHRNRANVGCVIKKWWTSFCRLELQPFERILAGLLFRESRNGAIELALSGGIAREFPGKHLVSFTRFTKSLQMVESLGFAEKRFLGGLGVCQDCLEIAEGCVKLMSLEKCESTIELDSNGFVRSRRRVQTLGVAISLGQLRPL